jgi:hypothetical protein
MIRLKMEKKMKNEKRKEGDPVLLLHIPLGYPFRNIFVTNGYGYVLFVVITMISFPH